MSARAAPRTQGFALRLRSARPQAVGLEVLAREAGVHPDLALRLVRLGVLAPDGDDTGRFPRDAAARVAQAVRLRRDLGVNYAGALLAVQLLARIGELEERLRRYEQPTRRSR
jgi:hypothetical protein